MTDDNDSNAGHPMANLLTAAQNGSVNVKMELEQFVYLDRDCQTFLDNIAAIKAIAERVSHQENWGLGEHYQGPDGKDLISGQKVVEWFQTKARGSDDATDNSLWAVMDSHEKVVTDIQETYRTIRKRITDQDADAAARYQQLEASLPQQPAPNTPAFHAPGIPPKPAK